MKKAGDKTPAFYDTYASPLGTLYLVFSGKYLSGIFFDKPSNTQFRKGGAPQEFIGELTAYFRGEHSEFKQKVNLLQGTDFEIEVWKALREIPYGETRSYKWVAEHISRPAAVRAVGQALSKNPVPIVIPCHRVIESDGSLGGYSAGINNKVRLLEIEYYSKMNKK